MNKRSTSNLPIEQLTPTIGIITALPLEYAAATEVLENRKNWHVTGEGAGRRCVIGKIPVIHSEAEHSVVISLLTEMGNNSAAIRATILLEHFPNIRSIIMVGIAGGIPNPEKVSEHVRLGDIVVSDHGGVVKYDFVKEEIDKIIPRHSPRPPSASLLEAVRLLKAEEMKGNRPWLKYIDPIMKILNIIRPNECTDILIFPSNSENKIPHPEDPSRVKDRPRVFIGPIASADTLLKNPDKRDLLRDQFGVKAVEMEASGIADATWHHEVGYLVIRGICDYCDQNKNDLWHPYAATVAAAYVRALLESMPAKESDQGPMEPASRSGTFTSLSKLGVGVENALDLYFQKLIQGNKQNINSLILARFGRNPGILFQAAPLIQPGIPQLPPNFAHREHHVNSFATRLKETDMLILTGSTGTGKTTLAKLIALAIGGTWRMVKLSNYEQAHIPQILCHLAALMEQDQGHPNVVLDDLDFSSPTVRQYEDYFISLVHIITARNGRIIITSKRALPNHPFRQLGLNTKDLIQVPAFDEDEIFHLAIQLGCPEEELARSWAKLILAQTIGHPQLVHARIIHLSEGQWPKPQVSDVLYTPADISHAQSDARALLGELPEEQRELIYRLSIVLGPFRRDHALAIGESPTPINYCGDAFDRLLGPWIEPLSGSYYCLSPLLINAADQVYSRKKIQSLHADICRAILNCGNFTTLEARATFFHAWTSRSADNLVYITRGLLTSPERIWKVVARDLYWFMPFGLAPQSPLFPENTTINSMLRMLQFRIAVEVEPKIATSIALTWDKEIKSYEPRECFLSERYVYSYHVLMHYQVEFPAKKLLALLVEITKIQEEQLKELEKVFNAVPKPPEVLGADGNFDPIRAFFCFIIQRCNSIYFLNEFLEGLEEIPPSFCRRMLDMFNVIEVDLAMLMIDRAWMQEDKQPEPNWPLCIDVLKKTYKFAIQWEVPILAAFAARAVAIVYDEYLHEIPQAMAMLDEAVRSLPSSLVLDDERATVLFHQEKYKDALDIWDRILPIWPSPFGSTYSWPLIACRKAGIAAANIDDWPKAAQFFMDGYQRAHTLNYDVESIGLLADAGFALWKAGEYNTLINAFEKVLEGIERHLDPEKDLASFTIREQVGRALIWIERTLCGESIGELAHPTPGMCSNPEYSEKIRELPLTPIDISWMHLALIEYHLKLESKVFEYVRQRFKDSRFPVVRSILLQLDVEYSFRRLEFERLPVQGMALGMAEHAMRTHHSQGKQLWEEELPIETTLHNFIPAHPTVGIELFIAALVAMSGIDSLNFKIFKKWRDSVKELPGNSTTLGWIDLAETILSKKLNEAITIMANKDEGRERRLLAALRVSMEGSVTPNYLFYAHVLLVTGLSQGAWAKMVADYLSALITRQWLQRINFRTNLCMPQITVPDIQSACNSQACGIKKAAQILVAASKAISWRFPQDLMEQLNNLAR